jgi:hypothetical protein
MGVLPGMAQDPSFLSPLGFKFQIQKLPDTNFFVQGFNFPSVSLNDTPGVQTPFNKIIVPGDHMTFGDFVVTFKLDEGMYSYFEIFDWIKAIGKPASFHQYATIAQNTEVSGLGVEVYADLFILDNMDNPLIKVTFEDVIPKGLGNFKLTTTDSDVKYLTVDATFKYREFDYTRLT